MVVDPNKDKQVPWGIAKKVVVVGLVVGGGVVAAFWLGLFSIF